MCRPVSRRESDGGRDPRIRQIQNGALQSATGIPIRFRTSQNGDRQNPKVRSARPKTGHQQTITRMVTLETDRLLLRMFQQSDLNAYAAMSADPEVMRFLGVKVLN